MYGVVVEVDLKQRELSIEQVQGQWHWDDDTWKAIEQDGLVHGARRHDANATRTGARFSYRVTGGDGEAVGNPVEVSVGERVRFYLGRWSMVFVSGSG